ncbi:MAG: type I phosphomannose isomerase catalytic subunit [Acidobacteriota bacterium]|nr:type I phosphomannose isomerase catalytic subunit [Acidobacteriota bacterium]
MSKLYPLVFEPILKEKVWGGRRLAGYGKTLPPGVNVGESWEIADLGATSPSGGGGGAERSVVAGGALAGATLHDVVERWGEDLLGPRAPAEGGDFPLLVKFLDAGEHLSVQVHPDPDYARAHPGAHLKNESWYVLEAEPGAVIFKGVREGVDRETLARALDDGTIVELIEAVPARPGDCHHLPSGTLHALGAGVLVAEVQTPSDTTFRLYDWTREYGREQRTLHIEPALECVRFSPPPAITRLPSDRQAERLAHTPEFDLWGCRTHAADGLALPEGRGCAVVMAVAGGVRVRSDGGAIDLPKGTTALIPAATRDSTRVTADQPTAFLVVTL